MLAQDVKHCISYPYVYCFGSQSFLYNFWLFFGRNVKRLGIPMTLFTCSVWFLPESMVVRALCIVYLLSFLVLLMAMRWEGGKDSATSVKNVHPSGILGMPFVRKLSSWAKHFCLWVSSTNLAAYFWVLAHSLQTSFWLSADPVLPLLVSGGTFFAVYILKLMQNTNDYYYLQTAWRMHNAELTYDAFNKDFHGYRSVFHVIRGLVEWVWVTAQTAFIVASACAFAAPALISEPIFWLSTLGGAALIGAKVAWVSKKFSLGYMEDKLCLTFCCYKEEQSGNLFPRLKALRSISEDPVVGEVTAPRSNVFYEGVLYFISKPCPHVSPFCIIDSDDSDLSSDEEEGHFVGAGDGMRSQPSSLSV